jgi:hypothetical protein
MKKFLAILGLAALAIAPVQAQSLFETVHKSATAKVNDPKSSNETIEINQFEVTALNYISTQVQKRALKKDTYFFDSQAVNLKSFVDDFLFYLNKARTGGAQKRNEVIDCYRSASLSNPLFNDSNKERVQCYVNDTKTFTPFSLDTDWEKAYDQATAKIKTILR